MSVVEVLLDHLALAGYGEENAAYLLRPGLRLGFLW
jgi:hypothetical protein